MKIYLREIRMSRIFELLLDTPKNLSSMKILINIRVLHTDPTVLQAGRSRVRFPMVSLEYFIDIILPVALWP